jgi:hypothetical protein
MDADYSVELGADDPVLEMPWSDPDGCLHYHDLRRQPETLLLIDEAAHYRELGEFLAAMNSSASVLQSAKCDVWPEKELNEAEQIYGVAMKLASYVDLLFCDGDTRFDFPAHESVARRVVQLLGRAPQISSAAEFIIRRCYYHEDACEAESPAAMLAAQEGSDAQTSGQGTARQTVGASAQPREGFYFTFYLFGYGDDESDARRRWGIGLTVVQNALLQVAAELRRAAEPHAAERRTAE